MRVLIVDDEAAARRRLIRLLSEFSDIEIIGEAKNGIEAISVVEALHPDLVFLDVRMPEVDGFEVISSLRSEAKMPLIVFATSYDDYALEAFNANAVAYLLKPVEPHRLEIAIERAGKLLLSEGDRAEDERNIRSLTGHVGPKQLRRIICRKLNRLIPVDPEQVLWFYIQDGIVRAQTMSDDYWTNYQLNQLENSLDPAFFFRARREILVNLSAVKSIKPYEGSTFALLMADKSETEIVVSERRARELRDRFPGL